MYLCYMPIRLLLHRIEKPARLACVRILGENRDLFRTAPGSSHNHQAWLGGYADHLAEVLNIACLLYDAMSAARPLPFSLSDALLVLFLHDLEKPWRFEPDGQGGFRQRPGLRTKAEKAAFREAKLAEYGVELTPDQRNAFTYVEGEGDDYSGERRTMNPLGAFCHMCDTASARLWHDHPLASGDPWQNAERGQGLTPANPS